MAALPTDPATPVARTIDPRLVRALLAYHDIERRAFAATCGLSPQRLSHLLYGYRGIGPAAERSILRGLAAYRLPAEAVYAHA
jgi:hypothetical protein